MKKNPFRKRYEFWLNLNSESENEIANIVDDLKSRRGYASAIRDGLKVIWELRQGKIETLVKLFPWVADRFQLQNDTTDVAALVEQFKSMMIHNQSAVTSPAPPLPVALETKPVVRIIDNDEERKQRAVRNTLAALDDF